MTRTVLVLGGGIGGIVAANRLYRLLPRGDRIVVVDREADVAFAASFPWVVAGHRTLPAITRPIRRLLKPGVELVTGTIEQILPEEKAAIVDGRRLAGDVLIVALGAALAPERIPGLAEAGHNFYTAAGTESLHSAMTAFAGSRLVVLTAAPAYKCPAAPYEVALLLEDVCRRRGIRSLVELQVHAAEPAPMGVAGPAVSAAVRQLLAARGIEYFPGHQVTSVDPAAKRLRFADGQDAPFDLLAFVPPHVAPDVAVRSGLTEDTGWIAADRHTLETRWPDVYALGDVVSLPLAMGKPLPKAGVFASAQAVVVARNVAARRRGRAAEARFDGQGMCFIETGGGKTGFGNGNFYAEPVPLVDLKPPGRRWHLGKVLQEQRWLRGWV